MKKCEVHHCVDCGCEIEQKSKGRATLRCDKCKAERRKALLRDRNALESNKYGGISAKQAMATRDYYLTNKYKEIVKQMRENKKKYSETMEADKVIHRSVNEYNGCRVQWRGRVCGAGGRQENS